MIYSKLKKNFAVVSSEHQVRWSVFRWKVRFIFNALPFLGNNRCTKQFKSVLNSIAKKCLTSFLIVMYSIGFTFVNNVSFLKGFSFQIKYLARQKKLLQNYKVSITFLLNRLKVTYNGLTELQFEVNFANCLKTIKNWKITLKCFCFYIMKKDRNTR